MKFTDPSQCGAGQGRASTPPLTPDLTLNSLRETKLPKTSYLHGFYVLCPVLVCNENSVSRPDIKWTDRTFCILLLLLS